MHPRFSNLLLTTAALIAFAAAPAAGGPLGGTVVGGSATIQGQGGPAVIVNQSSNAAIISWNTFNIGVNESVRFNQPSSSSVVLNRVTGGLGPSEIMGTLTANGRVFVINRDGILFGPSAVVNTAGFLATTHDIRNRDFMAGRYNFNIPGRPDASIVNQGRITATSGGFAALVAPGVRNSGTITATLGTVALASGNSFTLDLYGDKLITLAVSDHIASKVVDVATGRPLKSLVSNEGKIRANGGRVELSAAAARVVVDSVINTSGVIKANSIGHRNGMIVLSAATGASKPAGAPTQTVKISGTLAAAGRKKGTQGGTILVTGENIKLASARIDASGRKGGGKVLIGGDWGGGNPNTSLVKNSSAKLESFVIPTATTVSVDAGTTINASARGRGNGGKVVLWSDSETTFAGTILARGGAKSGDGGFVEVSSHQLLNYSGTTDTRAPKGTVGTLLLDPENFYVNASGRPPESDPTASAISADALVNQLASNNVVLSTQPSGTHAGDIFVDAHVSWGTNNNGTTNNNSLTLSAFHDILFMSGTQVTNTGAGNLVLRADNTGTGQGTVIFDPGGHVDYMQSTGTVSIFYNPSGSQTTKYQNPTDYFCPPCPGGGGVFGQQPSQLTAYMLVNNASDLQAVSTNLGGTYALGRSFSAAGFTGFAPGTTFTGLFDGNGGISAANYTISDLTLSSANSPVALFPFIESGATVRNLNLANVNITGTGSLIFLGTLAGENHGTIRNVHILSGTVAGGSQTGVVTGGLVAKNEGLIENSSSAANVSGGANSIVGGFAGLNGGTILLSTSSGAVTATSESYLGGFAGVNLGTIQSSTALASVSGTGDPHIIGGSVAANFGSTDGSSSAGTASGSTNSAVGGFAGANARFINFPAGSIPGSSFPVGTITNSTATGAAAGGQGSTVDPFIALNDPTSASNLPAFPSILAGCSNPLCGFLNTGILPPAGSLPPVVSLPPAGSLPPTTLLPPFSPALAEQLAAQQTQQIINLTSTLQLAALSTAPVFNTVQGGIQLPPQQQPLGPTGSQQGQQQQLPVGFDRRVIDIPPPTETRFVKDEVMLQIAGDVTVERLEAAIGRLGLILLASENLAITGSTVARFRVTDGRRPAEIIPALAAFQFVAVAQPNYVYALQQQPGGFPSPAHDDTTRGDPAQYILEKLKIVDVHRMVRGTNVPIAVIDSQIDVTHPDLEGAVAQRFDAAGAPEKPHPHGTGMAGAIAARQRLLGTAPAARLLAVHAFSTGATAAESTTFNILKGINWSAHEGTRIINMSFAGPKDPSLERALRAAYDRGIVLVAAAGNAGPKSPALFPGAYPQVIAVTATDADDKLFAGANRGKYVSVSAPGVDILVPAPENTYQITTGTSVAAAEVSGIVAPLLERNPKLTPADVRRILQASAKRLGAGERDDNFGSGLIDPLKALQLADPRTAAVTSPPASKPVQQ